MSPSFRGSEPPTGFTSFFFALHICWGGGGGREQGTGRGDVIVSERSGLELWSRSLQFSFA